MKKLLMFFTFFVGFVMLTPQQSQAENDSTSLTIKVTNKTSNDRSIENIWTIVTYTTKGEAEFSMKSSLKPDSPKLGESAMIKYRNLRYDASFFIKDIKIIVQYENNKPCLQATTIIQPMREAKAPYYPESYNFALEDNCVLISE